MVSILVENSVLADGSCCVVESREPGGALRHRGIHSRTIRAIVAGHLILPLSANVRDRAAPKWRWRPPQRNSRSPSTMAGLAFIHHDGGHAAPGFAPRTPPVPTAPSLPPFPRPCSECPQ